MASAINKDIVLVVSLVLSVASLVLLFGVTWYFQSSLDLLQQQVEYDRELLFKLQEQINVSKSLFVQWLLPDRNVACMYVYVHICACLCMYVCMFECMCMH